jgi:hypothetical protein
MVNSRKARSRRDNIITISSNTGYCIKLVNKGFAIKEEGLSLSGLVPIGVNLIEPKPAHPPPAVKKSLVFVLGDNRISFTLAKKKALDDPLEPPLPEDILF